MVYRFSRFLAGIIARAFFHLKAQGIENIPKKGAFILASNHLSYLDPGIVAVACPRRLNFIAKEDLFTVHPFFSWWLRNVDVIPVKRNAADISAFKESMRRLAAGKALLIFPEGSRQKGGVLGNPEVGVGFLAAKSNAPVIPVFIKGTDNALPRDAKKLHFCTVTISFGKQIPLERRMPYQDLALEVMNGIRHLSCTGLN